MCVSLTLLMAISAFPQLYGVKATDDKHRFNVIADKPYMMSSGEGITDYSNLCMKSGQSKLIHYRGDEERRPLCYPLDGENPVISFPHKKAELSEKWDLSELSERGGSIRAAEGKFKGWYLDWSGNEIEVMDEGKIKHVREMILVKEPVEPRTFKRFPISK